MYIITISRSPSILIIKPTWLTMKATGASITSRLHPHSVLTISTLWLVSYHQKRIDRRQLDSPKSGWLSPTKSPPRTWRFIILRFPEMGVPLVIIHFNGIFHSKPSILGYPHLWKPPFMEIPQNQPWISCVNLQLNQKWYHETKWGWQTVAWLCGQ